MGSLLVAAWRFGGLATDGAFVQLHDARRPTLALAFGQWSPLLRPGPPALVTRAEDFGTSDRKRGSRLNESWANAGGVVNGAEVFGPSDRRAGVCPVGENRKPEIRSMEPKTSGRVTGR